MAEQDVSTVEQFNVHFERLRSSTPIRDNLLSATDPYLIDTIPVLTSSESELEEDVNFDDFNEAFSGDIHAEINMEPRNLEQVLSDIHQDHPELHQIEPNKVYNMEQILNNIDQELQSNQQPTQQSQRPRRNLPLCDYKKLHTRGNTKQ